MVTYGNFVFIKGEIKAKDNNTYCNVTLECVDDEDIDVFSCEPVVFDKLKKYSKYNMAISTRKYTWDGQTREKKTIVDAKPM